jgi:hypothetical protein
VKADGLADQRGSDTDGRAVRSREPDRPAARPAAPGLIWEAPGLLLVGWCALIVALIVVRHVSAPLVPAASPHGFTPAYQLGRTDLATVMIGLVGVAVLGASWWSTLRGDPSPAAPPVRRVGWWLLIAASAVGVAVLTFAMLFRPLPTATDCPGSRIVHLNPSMGFVWNCDSSLFQQVAADPSRLFDEQHPRQARPLYAVLGFLLYQSVGRVAGWVGLGEWQGEDTRPLIALVVLNVLVLTAAVVVFARVMLPLGAPVAITAALAVPLALNGLTAEWTLTPHQQVFAMLVPVVTVLMARQVMLDPPGSRRALWWGLAVGAAANVYGSWLVTVVVVALALVLKLRLAAWRSVAAFVGGALAPIVGWILLCRVVVGSYFNHEAEVYRQLVWILDALATGPADLGRRSASYLLVTLQEILATTELWWATALIVVGVLTAGVLRVRLRPTTDAQRATMIGVGLTAGVTVAFLWAIGYYTPRLSMILLPLLLIVAGWVYARLAASGTWPGRAVTAVAAVAALVWASLTLAVV